MSDFRITEGSLAVAELVERHGAAELGRRLHSSEATVRHWATGRRKPTRPARAFLAEQFGVDESSFEREAPGAGDASQKYSADGLPTAPSAEPVSTKATLEGVIRDLGVALQRVRDDKLAKPSEIASIATAIVSATRALAKVTGDTDLTEAMICRSPAWARAISIVRGVLKKHPVALRELDRALEDFGAGGGA